MKLDNKTLAALQQQIRKFCDERDWDQFHNLKDLAISLSLESAELLEHFQWKNDKEVAEYVKDNKVGIEEELADVFYWVLLLANKLDIDLISAFESKMKQNETKYPVSKSKGIHKKYTDL